MKYLILILAVGIYSCKEPEPHVHNKNCVHWRVMIRPNGILQDSISYTFDSTLCNGVDKYFDENGSLAGVFHYYYGNRNGKSYILYPHTRLVEQINFYENDIKKPYSIKFYKNGKIKEIDSIEKWNVIGPSWKFDSLGNVQQKGIVKSKYIFKMNNKIESKY